MSVFQVKLNNAGQGLLDVNTLTGVQNAVSIQRTIYVTGPNGVNHLLKDGETFTGSNYWKRFTYPTLPLTEAILQIVSDDGSVYSDIPAENVYPKVYNLAVLGGSSWSSNLVDIAGDTGGYAVFTQISNTSSNGAIRVRLNGSSSSIFDLAQETTQVFNSGDVSLTSIEFENTESGSATVDVQVLLSVRGAALSSF